MTGRCLALVGGGGHIVGIDLAARIEFRGDDGWRRCAARLTRGGGLVTGDRGAFDTPARG